MENDALLSKSPSSGEENKNVKKGGGGFTSYIMLQAF